MTVTEYLRTKDITAGELARRLGMPRSIVYQWSKGTVPRGRNLERLISGTKEEDGTPGVTLEDILAPSVAAAAAETAGGAT